MIEASYNPKTGETLVKEGIPKEVYIICFWMKGKPINAYAHLEKLGWRIVGGWYEGLIISTESLFGKRKAINLLSINNKLYNAAIGTTSTWPIKAGKISKPPTPRKIGA